MTPSQEAVLADIELFIVNAKALERRAERSKYIRRGSPESALLHFVSFTLWQALIHYRDAKEEGRPLKYEASTKCCHATRLAVEPLPIAPSNVIRVDFRARR